VLLLKRWWPGNDEIVKSAGSRWIRRRSRRRGGGAGSDQACGERQTLTADDADKCLLLLAIFHARLGDDALAASTFLDHIEKYQNDRERRQFAFDNAMSVVAN